VKTVDEFKPERNGQRDAQQHIRQCRGGTHDREVLTKMNAGINHADKEDDSEQAKKNAA